MRESIIERYLARKVKSVGGECVKLYGKNEPDRECRFPGARLCYVETKATGKKPRAGQARKHAKLWAMGFPVLIIDSKALVDSFVERFSAVPKISNS